MVFLKAPDALVFTFTFIFGEDSLFLILTLFHSVSMLGTVDISLHLCRCGLLVMPFIICFFRRRYETSLGLLPVPALLRLVASYLFGSFPIPWFQSSLSPSRCVLILSCAIQSPMYFSVCYSHVSAGLLLS